MRTLLTRRVLLTTGGFSAAQALAAPVLLAALLGGAAFAQTSKTAAASTGGADTPKVIGILNYPHAVTDLERTVAFYKDVIGLELSRPPGDFPNPGVPLLVNSPGVKLRLAMFKMPGGRPQGRAAAAHRSGRGKPAVPRARHRHDLRGCQEIRRAHHHEIRDAGEDRPAERQSPLDHGARSRRIHR
jgi:hypothetical protein